MTDAKLDIPGFLELAAVYGLLSKLWLREVDLPMLESLDDPAFRKLFTVLGGKIPEEISESTVEELAIDYCQLLIGPKGHLSPIQSIWEDNLLQGKAASSMRRYTELLRGFRPEGSIPDHIGVQLQFMSELFAQASSADHPETFETIAKQFFEHHLSWPGSLLKGVAAKAETDFYRGLAMVTGNFLESARS